MVFTSALNDISKFLQILNFGVIISEIRIFDYTVFKDSHIVLKDCSENCYNLIAFTPEIPMKEKTKFLLLRMLWSGETE